MRLRAACLLVSPTDTTRVPGHAAVNPQNDPEAVGDPYKTLFISRLNYEATEEDLRREFNMYGPIERIRLVREESGKNKGKSRGYAFILYEREKDMKGGSRRLLPLYWYGQPR